MTSGSSKIRMKQSIHRWVLNLFLPFQVVLIFVVARVAPPGSWMGLLIICGSVGCGLFGADLLFPLDDLCPRCNRPFFVSEKNAFFNEAPIGIELASCGLKKLLLVSRKNCAHCGFVLVQS